MLTLTGLIFMIIIGTTIFNMRRLERYASSSGLSFSRNAVKENKAAMIAEYRNELLKMATSQAIIIDLQMQRIFAEVNAAAGLYKDITVNPVLADNPIFTRGKNGEPIKLDESASFCMPPGSNPADFEAEKNNFKRMFNSFRFLCLGNKCLSTVGIMSPSGLYFEYSKIPFHIEFDFRTREWYKKAVATPDRTIWVGPYDSAFEKRKVITFARAVTDANGKLLAVLILDLDTSFITQDFIITEKTGGAAFMINETGRIIARESYETKKLEWTENSEKVKNFEIQLINAMRSGQRGTMEFKIDNENFYIGYAPIKQTGWSVGITLPERNVLRATAKAEQEIEASATAYHLFIDSFINSKKTLYILVGGIMLLLITVIEYFFATSLTKPISILQQSAEKLGEGDLSLQISTGTGDELEELAKSFNTMGSNLKQHIKEIRENLEARQKIINELAVAAKIQASMLPRNFPAFPDNNEFDIFATMNPAREIGGDFYDFFLLDNARLCFCIGDVSGKGVPAALFMAKTVTLLRYEAIASNPPDEILLKVNNALEKNNDSCMFATVFLGILNFRTMELEYSNAGHNPPLLNRGTGYKYMEINKAIALGPVPRQAGTYKAERITLAPGNGILLYTDGVTEAKSPDGSFFGSDKLPELLDTTQEQTPEALIEKITGTVKIFEADGPQSDDITLLSIILK